jgi:adenylate cyclase
MLRLTLFGKFSAAGADGAEIPLKSMKAKALLAYLALPPGKSRSREEIMALLWSERGEAQARASLRQVLTGLRKELGEAAMAALVVTDDAVSLDPFEEWLRDERLRLEEMAAPTDQPAGPSIAVLPFVNMSGDPEQEYFADGITEDIITELSRFNEFNIIARNSSFHYRGRSPKIEDVGRELGVKYVVEGSVRRAADRVRVTAQLTDTETKTHIWADRYDRQLDDIFAIQDEMTEAVVARVADKVKGATTALSRSRPRQSMTAYDLVLQSRPHRTSMTRAGNERAAELLTRAIALDPDYALAHASLAFVRANDCEEYWADDRDAALHDAVASARRAVALDDSDGYAHASLAYVHQVSGDFDLATHEARLALSLNPNHVNIIMMTGWICVVTGDLEGGIEHIQRARRLNPYMGGFQLWTLGQALFGAKRYEEAIDAFSQVTDPPTSQFLDLASAYAYLGRDSDARSAMSNFLDRAKDELNPFPGDDPQAWRRYLEWAYDRRRKEDFEHILEGARKAGLPV